jgi:phosphate transport system substrate-binding protein
VIGSARKAIVIAALTLSSCSGQVVPAATPTLNTAPLRLYATPGTTPLMRDLAAEYTATYPTFTLTVNTGRYDQLVSQVNGNPPVYFLTNHLPADSPLWAAPVGQDAIAIVINADTPTRTLTSEQVRSIFQGNVGQWGVFDGGDTAIRVISRERGAATRYEFERLLMGERAVAPAALLVPSGAAMIQTVRETPGAIGYVSSAALTANVQSIAVDGVHPTQENVRNNIYPLRSTLFIVGGNEPSGDLRLFIGWVQSQAGQAVVARHYTPVILP